MNDVPVAEVADLPCPKCEYDLRAQEAARCPECGAEFESIQAMIAASQHARRLFVHVMKWRQRLAYFTLCSILSIIALGAWTMRIRRTPPIAAIGLLLLWPLSGLFAVILLIQVIRWRLHPLIPKRQRSELNGSIPWLLFLSAPFVLFVIGLIAALL